MSGWCCILRPLKGTERFRQRFFEQVTVKQLCYLSPDKIHLLKRMPRQNFVVLCRGLLHTWTSSHSFPQQHDQGAGGGCIQNSHKTNKLGNENRMDLQFSKKLCRTRENCKTYDEDRICYSEL